MPSTAFYESLRVIKFTVGVSSRKIEAPDRGFCVDAARTVIHDHAVMRLAQALRSEVHSRYR